MMRCDLAGSNFHKADLIFQLLDTKFVNFFYIERIAQKRLINRQFDKNQTRLNRKVKFQLPNNSFKLGKLGKALQ